MTSDIHNLVVGEIARYQSRLRAFVRCLLVRPSDVDDILQEINSVLWQKANEFQPGSDFWAWASQIARFEALNHLRTWDASGWCSTTPRSSNCRRPPRKSSTSSTNAARHSTNACGNCRRPKGNWSICATRPDRPSSRSARRSAGLPVRSGRRCSAFAPRFSRVSNANQLILDSLLSEELGAEPLAASVDMVGQPSAGHVAPKANRQRVRRVSPAWRAFHHLLAARRTWQMAGALAILAAIGLAFVMGRWERMTIASSSDIIVRAAMDAHAAPVERVYVVQTERETNGTSPKVENAGTEGAAERVEGGESMGKVPSVGFKPPRGVRVATQGAGMRRATITVDRETKAVRRLVSDRDIPQAAGTDGELVRSPCRTLAKDSGGQVPMMTNRQTVSRVLPKPEIFLARSPW